MNYYKVIGNPTGNNIELSCNFTRWLIGFGWIKLNQFKFERGKRISIYYFNLGPLAMIITRL